MKRTILVGLTILLTASVASSGEPYTWTISSSSSDPFANSAPFVPGVGTAYLWIACCELPDPFSDGMAAAEFDLSSANPANVLLATTPVNGFINAGTPTSLLLAVGGCPCGPLVAANILVLHNAPGQLCLIPSSIGNLTTVDCESTPTLWPMAWVGLSTDGSAPCSMGNACQQPPTSVEGASFGSVKALYR